MAEYQDEDRVQQSVGPTITSSIDFMDGSPGGERFVIEDDGFPNLLTSALRAAIRDHASTIERSLLDTLEQVQAKSPRGLMVWLGAGVDAGDGRLRLQRHRLSPSRRELALAWNPERSRGVIDAIVSVHRRMTEATGGRQGPDLGWELFRQLLTLHPLGGCRMAADPQSGVVDHLGRVFGYGNLYVVDGAIVPAPIGRNPSHTIAALAERIAEHVQ
jgi:cholesterol oxidase